MCCPMRHRDEAPRPGRPPMHASSRTGVVIAYDEDMRELAWWGPRPSWLQDWVLGEGRTLPPKERYREVRRWYAVDRGDSTVRELLAKLEAAARAPAA